MPGQCFRYLNQTIEFFGGTTSKQLTGSGVLSNDNRVPAERTRVVALLIRITDAIQRNRYFSVEVMLAWILLFEVCECWTMKSPEDLGIQNEDRIRSRANTI